MRRLFDYLVVGQIMPFSPAAPVRGPRIKVRKGVTPIISAEEASRLFSSIDTNVEWSTNLTALRDRALIATMLFTFMRISAAIDLKVGDYYHQGRNGWLRVHEKGGEEDIKPVHHQLEEYLDAYIEAAGIKRDRKGPLFRTSRNKGWSLTDQPIGQRNALRIIKYRARAAGLSTDIGNHTFRASGITMFRKAGGSIEMAQRMAGHADPRTTKLYDHSEDPITRREVERIQLGTSETLAPHDRPL